MPHTERDGRRIHWLAQGEGPTLVLVPGLGSGSKLFGTLPRRFARQGFHCVTIDPVGVPPSDPHDGRDWGPFTFEEAALDLIAVAEEASPSGSYALVGTSLGGKVSLLAAAKQPAGLTAMVLLASAAATSARAKRVYGYFRTLAEHLPGELLGPATAPFLFGKTFHTERPGVVDNIVRATRPDKQSMAFMASQARALEQFDGSQEAALVGVATLCVAGGEDTLTDPADVRATAALLPHGSFELLPNAGHSLLLEDSSCFELVTGFISRHG